MLQEAMTRGAVSIKTNDGWQGVFNHENSQPTIMGPAVWEELQENWKCLDKWGKALLECGYWEEFLNGGLCPYCGKYAIGNPHNVRADLLLEVKHGRLAPDPDVKRHFHSSKIPSVNSKSAPVDALWIEWVYLVHPKQYALEVFRSVRDEGIFSVKKNGRSWKQPFYKYFPMGFYSLFNKEPDWQEIEQRGRNVSVYYHRKYGVQSMKIAVL